MARLLEEAGIQAGRPERSLSGSVTVATASGERVALLTWVPGTPSPVPARASSG